MSSDRDFKNIVPQMKPTPRPDWHPDAPPPPKPRWRLPDPEPEPVPQPLSPEEILDITNKVQKCLYEITKADCGKIYNFIVDDFLSVQGREELRLLPPKVYVSSRNPIGPP